MRKELIEGREEKCCVVQERMEWNRVWEEKSGRSCCGELMKQSSMQELMEGEGNTQRKLILVALSLRLHLLSVIPACQPYVCVQRFWPGHGG